MSPRGADPEPIVVGLSWAARELSIGIDTARRLARAGDLPGAFLLGSQWRVSTVEFRRQIEARAARLAPVPQAPSERLAGVEWASVPRGTFRRSQGHTGRRIAAEAPSSTITGDVPLVRRRPPKK
jgi:Helix-turn-helix domain